MFQLMDSAPWSQLMNFVPWGAYVVFCLVPICFATELAGKKKISDLLFGIVMAGLLLLTCIAIMNIW